MKPNMLKKELCTNCSLCISQCSFAVLKKDIHDKVELDKDVFCIECGHCMSICPTGALRVFDTLPDDITPFPKEESFFNMLKSRRSMRKYQPKEVPEETISRLCEYARYSPTGSNMEGTKVLIVKSKEEREKITNILMSFWIKVEKVLRFSPIKWIAGLFTSRERLNMRIKMLNRFVSRYKKGLDTLFYNAPVIAFLYTEKGGSSTPKDDCCYALFSMVLGAEALGLSSCINQLAVISFEKNKKKVRKALGLKKTETISACASFGYPGYDYKRTIFRKPLIPVIK